jgi:preprotein translocase SecE subunit
MARNRKRAKERRTRQPVASGRMRADRAPGEELGIEPTTNGAGDGAPDPIAHAAPGAELAEAQLALGAVEAPPARAADEAPQRDPEPETVEEAAEPELVPAETTRAAVAAPRPWVGARLLGFLEGSWRELQRVQWPDRRQVMQATGVVIGFVIVASVFLGVADLVANKVVQFVIYGK